MSDPVDPHHTLVQADSHASQLPSTSDSVVLPCQRYVIEVRVLDEAGAPLAAIPVAVLDETGRALRSKTDSAGLARFIGLVDKPYTYSLYSLAADSWEQVEVSPLEPGTAFSDEPAWSVDGAAGPPAIHTVRQDECVTKLADRFGFTPSTIWNANADLASARASMNILAPDDRLTIPMRTPRVEPALVAHRYTVKRLEAMTWLRIRFLDVNGNARSEVPYLLSIERQCERPFADIAERTTSEGFVIQRIPADTSTARITLDGDEEQEIYLVHLSRLDPASVPRGIQARLNNLGYGCGEEDGEFGPATRRAIRYFQQDQLLTPSGEADAATVAFLVRLHGS
jgi:hypothetical protein